MSLPQGSNQHQVDKVGAIISACLMSAAGAAVFLVLPVFLSAAVDSLKLSAEQAGFLVSVYNASYAFICISAFFWIRRINWRTLAFLAYAALSGGFVLSALSTNINVVVVGLIIAGAGAGGLFGLGVTIISDTLAPDRNFGLVLVSQQVLAALLLFWLPSYVVLPWGFTGLCWALALSLGVLAGSLPWVPTNGKPHNNNRNRQTSFINEQIIPKAVGAKVLFGLLALTVYFAALSSVWAFLELFAQEKGLSHDVIGSALAISMLGGVFGGLLAAMLGERYGRIKPILASTIIFIIVFLLFDNKTDFYRFCLAVSLFSFAWNFVLAYQMGSVAEQDNSGRAAVLIPAAQSIGAVIGPALGGMVLSGINFNALLVGASLSLILSLLPFLWLESQSVRSVPITTN